ncbi:hypothetical protein PoB_003617000 [Plakobranchus ocellatus]|uniref:Uncharacterized protein n=1 Tax=Plakobranchus ocellatus TaxID=259542 RepID=A0AAV4AQR2_9GAST|nr:hypothetical protein PoB_003617000 [Plakobranchus ocellatus]
MRFSPSPHLDCPDTDVCGRSVTAYHAWDDSTDRYRNMFDMNWLHALLFSNGLGGAGGSGANIMPWLFFGNMM